jgi:hypothetical protein
VARSNLARVLLARGRADDALVIAEQVWTRRQRDDVPPMQRAISQFLLAQALWEANPSAEQRQRARTLAEGALEVFRNAGAPFSEEAASVAQWLEHPTPVVQ